MASAAELQEQMFEFVARRDFAGLRELYHPDCTYTAGDGVEQPGADAGVAVAEIYTTAFPDLTFVVRSVHTAGNGVAVMEFTAVGTHQAELEGIPATGRKVEVLVCNVVEERDGKIYREREYYDTLSILRQLGVAE